jgi:hypothetical protein
MCSLFNVIYKFLPLVILNESDCVKDIKVIFKYNRQDATLHNSFISARHYMFQVVPLPIIRTSKTVHTASGICKAITATFRYRGGAGSS